MAEDSNANPFQDLLNAEIENIKRREPPKKGATTGTGLVKEVVSTYPRASLTTAAVGTAAYKGVTGWKKAYKEGLELVRKRGAEETKMVKDLAKSGIEAMPRLDVSNATTRQLAKQYATEKLLSGFPFKNSEAARTVADLKTGRVILTGEKVVGVKPIINLANNPTTITTVPYLTPQAVAQTPKQVTLETAGKIPKFDLKPSTYVREAGVPRVDLDSINWSAKTQPTRVRSAPAYTPPAGAGPSLPKRVAQLSTGGLLGKANVGLETAGVLYDLGREGGVLQSAYEEGVKDARGTGINPQFAGVTYATLKGASRLGRGASNALTFGAPEYLGVYDTLDLLQVEADAKNRYMQLRGTTGYPAENFPVIKKDGKYVPMEGNNPYLSMLEARIAAERGINSSLITEGFYKGPEYNYIVVDGKVTPMMKPEYSAMYDAQSVAAMDAANNRRPVFNADPNFGNMGWQRLPQPVQTFGDYVDYMKQR